MKVLNSFHLKMIGIITMTIDHIGYIMYPDVTWLRIVGRIAFPIFAFLIAEGFRHTRDVNKYFIRLSVFALVIQLPFILFRIFPNVLPSGMSIPSIPMNIFFTLALGLLILIILEKGLKYYIAIIPIIALAWFIEVDYGIYGLLAIVIMYYFKNWKLLIAWILLNLLFAANYYYGNDIFGSAFNALNYSRIQLYSLMAVILILLYNGKQGLKTRYLFYFYYPLHMIVIFLIDMI